MLHAVVHIVGEGLLGLCAFVSLVTLFTKHYHPTRGDASAQSQTNRSTEE